MNATLAAPPAEPRRASRGMRTAKKALTLSDVLHALGDIDASRIHYHKFGRATVDDAIKINEQKEGFVELVEGVLVEKAKGFPESYLAMYIGTLLLGFVDAHNLGIAVGADGMLRVAPNLLRIPDVSFVSWERVQGKVPREAAPAVAPDLAVEVISPGNTVKEMERKCGEYFKSGAKLVWMVYPKTRTVTVYSSPARSVTLAEEDVLSGGTILPGFSLEVRKLFGQLDRTRDGLAG
ncbi:MAG TPA: Uma2 family endonuclease [Planctomycetota bacterium]|nr:Uma2 family endonuclease [Planctomycetota bacterium]